MVARHASCPVHFADTSGPIPPRSPTPKFVVIALWIGGALVAGFVALMLLGFWVLSHNDYSFADRDLSGHLIGRWDWSTRGTMCGDSAQVISFSHNLETMTISKPATATDTGWKATYDILRLTPSRLRGAIRGEKRLTAGGAPVVWDLVMFGPDEFRWHRTDWLSVQYTAPMRRCPNGASEPVEKDSTLMSSTS